MEVAVETEIRLRPLNGVIVTIPRVSPQLDFMVAKRRKGNIICIGDSDEWLST